MELGRVVCKHWDEKSIDGGEWVAFSHLVTQNLVRTQIVLLECLILAGAIYGIKTNLEHEAKDVQNLKGKESNHESTIILHTDKNYLNKIITISNR